MGQDAILTYAVVGGCSANGTCEAVPELLILDLPYANGDRRVSGSSVLEELMSSIWSP